MKTIESSGCFAFTGDFPFVDSKRNAIRRKMSRGAVTFSSYLVDPASGDMLR